MDGAKAGAILYSLIETCKHHQIDPYLWLRYTLKYLPQADRAKAIENFLPYHCDPAALQKDLEKDRKLLTHALQNIDQACRTGE